MGRCEGAMGRCEGAKAEKGRAVPGRCSSIRFC
jgi:hypothetical protein